MTTRCRPTFPRISSTCAARLRRRSSLVQDALYDAEEYLRSELAEQPGRTKPR